MRPSLATPLRTPPVLGYACLPPTPALQPSLREPGADPAARIAAVRGYRYSVWSSHEECELPSLRPRALEPVASGGESLTTLVTEFDDLRERQACFSAVQVAIGAGP